MYNVFIMRNTTKRPKAAGTSYREGITVMQLLEMFPDEESATEWFENTLWNSERCCGHCGSVNTHDVPNRKPMPYRCRDCRKYFSIRTGTPLAHSNVKLRKWAVAIYLEITSLKSISSINPDYSWNILIRASNPAFSCGRSPVSLEPLSIRLNRLKNRTIEPAINRIPARGTVIRRQVDFPVRNSHRFGPFHGPDASSVHYPGAQDTRASLCHNRFQFVAP